MQKDGEAAHEQWHHVTDSLRERYEKLAVMVDGSREEVLAYMAFPKEHWPQISSTISDRGSVFLHHAMGQYPDRASPIAR